MSDSCDVCGYKSSEIKGGGAMSDRGRLITLQVTEQEDLRRDVIKADSASVSACTPELSASAGQASGRNMLGTAGREAAAGETGRVLCRCWCLSSTWR